MYCSAAEMPWPTHFYLQMYLKTCLFGTDSNKCHMMIWIVISVKIKIKNDYSNSKSYRKSQ